MQERARVIAGADDVMRLYLERVRLPPAEANLMTPLKQFSIALRHAVMAIGCAVIHACTFRPDERAAGTHSGKRAPHARQAVGTGDFVMARGAGRRICVGGG